MVVAVVQSRRDPTPARLHAGGGGAPPPRRNFLDLNIKQRHDRQIAMIDFECLSLVLSLAAAVSAFADSETGRISPEEPATFCETYKGMLDRFTVYHSDTGFLRNLAFAGRYQGQFFHNSQHANASALQGAVDDNDTDWYTRRFRFGFKADLLDSFSLAADVNLDPTWSNDDTRFAGAGYADRDGNGRRRGEVGFFQNFYRIELDWKLRKGVTFALGKLDPDVTLEDAMSTAKLYTVEMSSAAEMLNHDSTGGAKLELNGVLGNDVVLGVFNGGTEDDHRTYATGSLEAQVSNLPQTNGDWGVQVKLNRNLWQAPANGKAPAGDLEKVRAGLWWFHAQDSEDPATMGLDTNYEEFTDVMSANSEVKGERWGALSDLLYGNVDSVKDNDTDVWGIVLMPYVDVTKKLQLVYRYVRMWGNYDEEDRLAGRGPGVDLECRLRTGSGMMEGDALTSHYLGLNYYLCGHNLKLQFGLEHLGLEDPRPGTAIPEAEFWSYQSAVKMFF